MFRYSPLPIDQYRVVSLPTCEVAIVQGHPKRDAIWNLFWLSVPALDHLPGTGRDWWKHYKPVHGALSAVIRDVLDDEVLFRKLLLHPSRFIEWFERDDHSVYECYEVIGTPWVDTVLVRAEEAATRRLIVPRVWADSHGIHIDFQTRSHDSV